MDLFSLMVVLLANWDSWSLEDLITVMLQDIDDAEDSFWAILQAVCSSIEDEQTGRDWWVFPRSDCWWDNLVRRIWNSPEISRDKLWRKRFRMSHNLFLKLMDFIEPFRQA
ncbi:hypothetical protein R1flu_001008 [Riccia fluitans]|uniref:Uncharacterized protein n=1 Tax=Riccia fluitans TaxID=41844 RepID=A0ABD1Y214_9MARC